MHTIHWVMIGSVVMVLSGIIGLTVLSEVGNMNEASQYCGEHDKVSVRITSDTYICVDPEDKV